MEGKNTYNSLEFVHDHHIRWQGRSGLFSILGNLPMDVSALRISLHIEKKGLRKQRLKIDLYDYEHIKRHVKRLWEEEGFEFAEIESDLLTLTGLLETYRDDLYEESFGVPKITRRTGLSLAEKKRSVAKLKSVSLLEDINGMLGQIGIAGETDTRLLLFIIGTSYKHTPLHAVIQSSSGSGKSHVINTIAGCFPDEDLLSLSRITSKSLYHYKSETLHNKLVVIQDFDGLDDEALYAFRELQSFGKLTTSITGKDAFGNHTAKLHTVEGNFASFGATTKDLYTDNASRSIVLSMDESNEQTERILSYVAPERETIRKVRNDLKNMIRQLQSQRIVNPYAEKLTLPHTVPMARRLNQQLRQFIEQITFLHQYARTTDENGCLVVSKEDVTQGLNLFMDCLWIKVDELPPATRTFFEQLKNYAQSEKGDDEQSFNQRELRHSFSISRSALHRHMKILLEMEYIEIVSGTANKGYRYALSYVDNQHKLKSHLMHQIHQKLFR